MREVLSRAQRARIWDGEEEEEEEAETSRNAANVTTQSCWEVAECRISQKVVLA